MSGMLGLELPATNSRIGQFLPYGYASPPVDLINGSLNATPVVTLGDGTQIWRITQNGVDTHTIHTHLVNAQLINRVGWDGMMIPPDANELGWKETFRVNPLEQTFIAFKAVPPTAAQVPFIDQIPNSVRLIDPTKAPGVALDAPPPAGWFDPKGNGITSILNHYVNFGWEYVYHCHILAHEENDMMHSFDLAVAPTAPSNLIVTLKGSSAILIWTSSAVNATGFTVQRAADAGFTTKVVNWTLGNVTTFTDTSYKSKQTPYYYRVFANNVVGDTATTNFPTISANSAFSNTVGAPTGTTALSVSQAAATKSPVVLNWTYTATDQTGFTIQRATNNTFSAGLTTIKVAGNITTYSDTKIKAGTPYFYRVMPTNDLGIGSPSNTVSITPHA
jgi:hypothetical protein